MGTAELKSEIEKVLDKVPEDTLQSVLIYLKSIVDMPKEKVQLSGNLRIILEEDKELLQKLAQ